MAHSFKKLETSHTGILSPIVSVLSLFLISIFHLSLSLIPGHVDIIGPSRTQWGDVRKGILVETNFQSFC